MRVLSIVEHIRDLNGLAGECNAAGHARPILRVWMLSGEFVCGLSDTICGCDDEDVALGEVEQSVLGITEPLGRLEDLFENRLQPFSASHCLEHAAQRTLLRPKVL